MPTVAVVGGGPAGLSTALFTAKNDLDTLVFDTDETWMHKAKLYNYPGIDEVGGTELLERMREQVERFDADLRVGEEVTAVEQADGGFSVTTEDGEYDADYVVFATGTDTELPEELGCETTDDGLVDVDLDMRTSVEDAYAVGSMIRDQTWEAVISAGDGAAAALAILSTEAGEPVHDFDTPGA
ncbi:NAD(P)/FAD-dependent oxidoreductase (plasmid) [Halorussus salilacus]|uniref:NAD(P)/FAD-dependent oxidoreductase n=1 Tax=Halorussus salilacus TaxID=2953750 RepID=UPI0020A1219B|nr:NAD(P)/FAD-dependent oxidoreductase [Halorussus salilacus]USZ69824.1 NAD(P)/FAD-dependent oxidoreductase [Halorussus salilacus]